ncbi:MAG: GntR family transcriptional regulator [Hyphomicrobiales bacterium]|nr:GntR family transcriptional regulator [Hyphomicrobiales bacterium]
MAKRRDSKDVTTRLREAITSGRFQPNERLIEMELAALLAANRTNVRTALAQLEQEGLVVREANRGARVRLVSHEDAIEITQARGALEALIAGLAARAPNGQIRCAFMTW